jgi:prepilin-type N-terminal cleavage/methylation domain-containing protein
MKGFTIIELLVSIGVIVIILTLVLPNMLTPQRQSAFSETITSLASDLREQQLKAMLRDGSVQGSPTGYGIYFDTHNYVLFRGTVYSPSATDNFTIDLDPQISFSDIGFPGSQIVFSPGSGEAGSFISGTYTVTIGDASENISNIITVDRYGTATQIN